MLVVVILFNLFFAIILTIGVTSMATMATLFHEWAERWFVIVFFGLLAILNWAVFIFGVQAR